MAYLLLCFIPYRINKGRGITMEVSATLKNSVDNIVSLGSDATANKANKSADASFSGHYEEKINSLKNKRGESPSQVEKNLKKPDSISDVDESKDVKKEAVSFKVDGDETVVSEPNDGSSEELSLGLENIKDGTQLLEQTVSLSTEVDITHTNTSGNELPQAAELGALAHDEFVSTIGKAEKDIIFDPLSQAKESSAQIAALTTGQLPGDKVRVTGKNNAIAPLGDSSRPVGVPTFVLERGSIPVENINTVMEVAKKVPSSTAAVVQEAAPINIGALTQGAVSQPLTEKPSIQLDTPMGHPKWSEGFNQRVQWVVNQSMSGAQIRLNPQNMGPIEVRIQMQNEQATVSFTAQHGATREAIDAALPRLREMLSEQNVNLGNIDVSEHSFAEQHEQASKHQDGEQRQFGEFADEEDGLMFDQPVREYNGLFSEFA